LLRGFTPSILYVLDSIIKNKKHEYGENAGRLDETRRTGNRSTENTGINAPGIMGKLGDTWRGLETSTKTGETDQGVTHIIVIVLITWG
jgi:hypothetical protein